MLQWQSWRLCGRIHYNIKMGKQISETHKKNLIIAAIILISMGIVMIGLMRATLSGRDLMQKYDVYQSGNYVVVECKETSRLFCVKERIYYSDFIKDAYLCTKEREKARSEEEAFLYVDLGVLGAGGQIRFKISGMMQKYQMSIYRTG